MRTIHRHAWFATALLCALLPAGGAWALTVTGKVVNGTAGGAPVTTTVHLISPSEGMEPVSEVQSTGGRFTMSNIDVEDGSGIYLLRVDHQGVMYTEMVQAGGRDAVDATITVYDTTSSWNGVHVVVPHIAAASDGGELHVEMLFEIHNHADPPRTIEGQDAQFRVFIPEEKIEITRSFVTFGEVPIDRFPVPTDEDGYYRVDYPIRPGETSVGISYTVPYTGDSYTLAYALPSDIENATVYAVNPGMTVTSKSTPLGKGEVVDHQMTAYSLTSLTKGAELQLTFSGGRALEDTPAGNSSASAGTGSIIVLPPRGESASFMLMVIILLALLAFVGIAERGAVNPLDDSKQVRAYYNNVLERVARLDDLHATNMVPRDVYTAKRAELKTQLAALRYRLHMDKNHKGKKSAARGHTPKMAGNERRSAS